MGQALSGTMAALDSNSDKDKQAKEQLEIIFKLCDARLDTFESKLKTRFLDQSSSMKRSVPGRRALRFERDVRVDTHIETSKAIETIVNNFFGTAENPPQAARDGFKSVVQSALSTILKDTSQGESYDEKFFISVKHNTLIRLDVNLYKYNFANEGVLAGHNNVLAYILCISVVDPGDITVDELTYLASEFVGDGSGEPNGNFNAYLENLTKTWQSLRVGSSREGRPVFSIPSIS